MQQVVELSIAEMELCVAVKTSSEALGIQGAARDLAAECAPNRHLESGATLCVVNRTGQIERRRHAQI